MRTLRVSTTRLGQFDVIHPAGSLDLASVPRLRTILDALLEGAGRHLVVDLSAVDFIDCSAIGVLVGAQSRAVRAHGSLRAVGAVPLVLEVMEITGVAKAMEAHRSLADAVGGPPLSGHEQHGLRATELLLGVLHRLPAEAPERPLVREVAIELAVPFALALARRFRGRGQPREDLAQVATLGLLKAVDRYDPEVGRDFAAFAAPTILGEVRRHFRDRAWYVQVPRQLKELLLRVRQAQCDLEQRLARSPTVDDVARHLAVEPTQVLAVLEIGRAFAPRSLSEPLGHGASGTLGDLVGEWDGELSAVEDRQVLGPALARLNERERRILAMRFYDNLTQAQIGDRLGLSQMHVSRLMRGALRKLRGSLQETADG